VASANFVSCLVGVQKLLSGIAKKLRLPSMLTNEMPLTDEIPLAECGSVMSTAMIFFIEIMSNRPPSFICLLKVTLGASGVVMCEC